jgi:predicted esterase
MIYTHYRQVDATADKLCAQGKQEEALALLKATSAQFPEYLVDNSRYQVFLYSDAGQYEKVYAILETMIRQGYFFEMDWLEQPSKEKFNPALIQENERLKALAQARTCMEYAVYLPDGYDEGRCYPLFIVLHGDGGHIERLPWYWPPEATTDLGFISVYVQSSQVYASQRFAWLPKPQIARQDIKNCYELVKTRYTIDPGKVIVGGFSGGAITAVDVTLADMLPVRGFVCISPELKPESFTIENVRRATGRGVRGVFMEGEKKIPVPDEQEMMQAFQEAGLPCQFYVNAGVGHEIPQDVVEKLRQAVDFVMDNR